MKSGGKSTVTCVEWVPRGDRMTEWVLLCRVCKVERLVKTGSTEVNGVSRRSFETDHAACLKVWGARKGA